MATHKQLVSPNLDPVVYSGKKALLDWLGWCLATVETAFRTPRNDPSAWEAWEHTQFKHQDQDFPVGVYFVIWYSWWGTVNGVYGNWGHVAIAYVHPDTGALQIWSAPYTHKPYFDTFSELNLGGHYKGISFVGWSEDLAGVRLIEPVTNPAPVHPYTVESIPAKQVISDTVRTKWNLDNTAWSQFSTNPVGTLAPNTPVTVVGVAHHKLGGKYYMDDLNTAAGYNVVDVKDYTPPVIVNDPLPPVIPEVPNVPTPTPTPVETPPVIETPTPPVPPAPQTGTLEPKTPKPAVEGLKEAARVALLAGAGVIWYALQTNTFSWKVTLIAAGLAALKGLDKWVHANPNIPFKGILPF